MNNGQNALADQKEEDTCMRQVKFGSNQREA